MIRDKIIITKTVEERVNGKPIKKDVPIIDTIAVIIDLYGQELYGAMAMELQNTAVFKIRYCKLTEEFRTNKNNYKVKYGDIVYNLYQADFSKYPRKYVLLKCNQKG